MRELTHCEMSMISGGGYDLGGYDFSFAVKNTLTGCAVGVLFPGIAATLGLTAVIANPILATGALFGTYALAKMGANVLDQSLFTNDSQPIAISVAA